MKKLLYRYLRAVRRTLTPDGTLSQQTVSGGVWAMGINVSDRLLQLAMVVLVARLIGPEQFGLMGIALLTLTALKRFTELGIDASLIQHKETDVDRYLNTAWTLQFGRGTLLALIAFLLAPPVAAALGEPEASPLIRGVSLSMLLQGLVNPGVMYLRKNLDFHRQFVYRLSGRVVYVGVAVAIALAFQSVWALVLGHIAGALTRLVVSFLVHPYRPRPGFDSELAREMLDYGKWIFGSSILGFLTNEGDDVFVGWFLGAASLGVYQMAYRISNAPATEITHTISQVVFPTYSKLQDDVEALRQGYFTTIQLVTFVSFPLAAGIALVMPSFVIVFLGESWRSMILPAQILAIYGLLHSLRTAAVPLFRAVDHPEYDTKIRFLKLAVIAVLIYPASAAYGLVGASLVIVANSLVANPVAQYLALRITEGRVVDFARLLVYPALGTTAMAACVVALQQRLVTGSPLLELVGSVAVGVVAYALAMLAIERGSSYDMIGVAVRIRESMS